MDDNQQGQPEYNKKNWSDLDKLLEENKRLFIENKISKENYKYLVNGINKNQELIDRLVSEHYAVMKENNRMITRILEEIDSINQVLTARSKKDE